MKRFYTTSVKLSEVIGGKIYLANCEVNEKEMWGWEKVYVRIQKKKGRKVIRSAKLIAERIENWDDTWEEAPYQYYLQFSTV